MTLVASRPHGSTGPALASQAASSLEEAQRHRLALIGEKLALEPGQRLLDIGCDSLDLARLQERPFDRIVSVGMLEHVGPGHLRRFFREVRRALQPEGLALVHSIGDLRRTPATDPWIAAHVFPGGRLPAAGELADALGDDLLIEDWYGSGSYLLCCAGVFRARQGQLWQLELSKADRSPTAAPYRSVRPGPCPLASAGEIGR